MTDFGGSDNLRDELKTAISTYAFSGSGEEIGTDEVVVAVDDAVLMAERVVVRRLAEAWDEGYRSFGDYLEGPEFDVLPRNPYRAASIETGEEK